ncbi:WD40-repeat-containing domain protein, partial [Suillus tomentosus]
IMTCSFDASLQIWNLKSRKQIGDDWQDRDSGVWTIALSPDGKKTVSGSMDGGVRLWDMDTGKPIGSPLQHPSHVLSVSFSVDGKLLATGCDDNNAYTWDVS